MKQLPVYLLALVFVSTIICCNRGKNEYTRPKAKPIAELIKENDSLAKENVILKLKLHITDTLALYYDKAYKIPFKPYFDMISALRMMSKEILTKIREAQLKIFFVADNRRLDTSSNVSLKDLQNVNNREEVTYYFCGDSLLGAAHKLKLKIRYFCKNMKQIESNRIFVSDKTAAAIDSATEILNTTDIQLIQGEMPQTWENVNFMNVTAAEDYVFLESLKNKILKARLLPIKYWEDEEKMKKEQERIEGMKNN